MTDFDHVLKDDDIIKPLGNTILVHNMEYGERKTASGLVIPDDNGKESGIRPRFATVYAIGNKIDYLNVGDKILVAHGRWTRGVKVKETDGSSTTVRRVDPKDILLVCQD